MLRGYALAAGLTAWVLCCGASGDTVTPTYVTAALSDMERPAADRNRDAARKPAEMIAFAGIKPGDTVLELMPGAGYFTRIFSKVIGPQGHLFAAAPVSSSSDGETALSILTSDIEYANVIAIPFAVESIRALQTVDSVWTSLNYHDLHLSREHVDIAALDKALFGILKKGGTVVIVDHAALPGSPAAETADALHRIDPAIVRREMEAAGFRFDGESDVLRNPADLHLTNVKDPAIRGRTDQFVYRFRKPA